MGVGIWTIQQDVAAGNQFNESDPDGTKTEDGHTVTYDDCTNAGLFSFDWNKPVEVRRILLDAGDATDWHWRIRSDTADGNEDFLTFERGDFGDNQISIVGEKFLLLMPGDSLLLSSSGATNTMYAEVTIEPKY